MESMKIKIVKSESLEGWWIRPVDSSIPDCPIGQPIEGRGYYLSLEEMNRLDAQGRVGPARGRGGAYVRGAVFEYMEVQRDESAKDIRNQEDC